MPPPTDLWFCFASYELLNPGKIGVFSNGASFSTDTRWFALSAMLPLLVQLFYHINRFRLSVRSASATVAASTGFMSLERASVFQP